MIISLRRRTEACLHRVRISISGPIIEIYNKGGAEQRFTEAEQSAGDHRLLHTDFQERKSNNREKSAASCSSSSITSVLVTADVFPPNTVPLLPSHVLRVGEEATLHQLC